MWDFIGSKTWINKLYVSLNPAIDLSLLLFMYLLKMLKMKKKQPQGGIFNVSLISRKELLPCWEMSLFQKFTKALILWDSHRSIYLGYARGLHYDIVSTSPSCIYPHAPLSPSPWDILLKPQFSIYKWRLYFSKWRVQGRMWIFSLPVIAAWRFERATLGISSERCICHPPGSKRRSLWQSRKGLPPNHQPILPLCWQFQVSVFHSKISIVIPSSTWVIALVPITLSHQRHHYLHEL